jgi:polar amino acid transport system substrate-binding protein
LASVYWWQIFPSVLPSSLKEHLVTDPAAAADLAPTGVLRASINLGNPVLAQGTSDGPTGVTVDLARELAARLGVPVSFACFDAARKSFEALTADAADVAFLAIEPAREAELSFTAAYVLIEGVYAVPDGSPITTASEVDRPGVRVGVKDGSAYDLFLSRTLTQAEVVRGSDGIDVFRQQGLEVAAGIRQPLARHVASDPGLRLVEPRFMQIRQAIATTKNQTDAAVAFLREFVETVKASGFVADALARSGQDATVAPPS